MSTESIIHLCTGCGLCGVLLGVNYQIDKRGFRYPRLNSDEISFCSSYCPAGQSHFNKVMDKLEISAWGEYKRVYLGWSNDAKIRYSSSSGGILSELGIYLLESNLVDGIIQVRKSKSLVETEVIISRSREDVLSCAGSRYTVSYPLDCLGKICNSEEKLAFIGKPCDVSVLRLYKHNNPSIFSQIKYYFSFFCAGQPSFSINKTLLNRLACNDIEDCEDLNYRGNGWPGKTVARRKDGTETSISYEEAWGNILGRDIRPSCRFCMDGIGLFADVCCGDAWYCSNEGSIDFSEHDGRNIIFARSSFGEKIIERMRKDGKVTLMDGTGYLKYLNTTQAYQLDRKVYMYDLVSVLRLFNYSTPDYDLDRLSELKRLKPLLKRIRRMAGTIKRVINGCFTEKNLEN